MTEEEDLLRQLRTSYACTLLSLFGQLSALQKRLGAWELKIDTETLEVLQGPGEDVAELVPDKFDREKFCKALTTARKAVWEAMGHLEARKPRKAKQAVRQVPVPIW